MSVMQNDAARQAEPSTAARRAVPGGDPAGERRADDAAARRIGAVMMGTAALMMAAGAAIWAPAGVDIDGAVTSATVPSIVGDIAAAQGRLTVTYTLWLLAMPVWALGGRMLARSRPDDLRAAAAATVMQIGATVGLVSFTVFLALINAVAPFDASQAAARGFAFVASTSDWVATVALVGIAPPLWSAVFADRLPRWHRLLGGAAGVAGVVTVATLLLRTGTQTVGFAIVPLGLLWTLAAAILLGRNR